MPDAYEPKTHPNPWLEAVSKAAETQAPEEKDVPALDSFEAPAIPEAVNIPPPSAREAAPAGALQQVGDLVKGWVSSGRSEPAPSAAPKPAAAASSMAYDLNA